MQSYLNLRAYADLDQEVKMNIQIGSLYETFSPCPQIL